MCQALFKYGEYIMKKIRLKLLPLLNLLSSRWTKQTSKYIVCQIVKEVLRRIIKESGEEVSMGLGTGLQFEAGRSVVALQKR